jgi:hypothetical protein
LYQNIHFKTLKLELKSTTRQIWFLVYHTFARLSSRYDNLGLRLRATAIPLLSAEAGNLLHLKIKAIKAMGDSLWADIFPKGGNYSASGF